MSKPCLAVIKQQLENPDGSKFPKKLSDNMPSAVTATGQRLNDKKYKINYVFTITGAYVRCIGRMKSLPANSRFTPGHYHP